MRKYRNIFNFYYIIQYSLHPVSFFLWIYMPKINSNFSYVILPPKTIMKDKISPNCQQSWSHNKFLLICFFLIPLFLSFPLLQFILFTAFNFYPSIFLSSFLTPVPSPSISSLLLASSWLLSLSPIVYFFFLSTLIHFFYFSLKFSL